MKDTYDIGETGLASHLSIGRVLEVNTNTYTAAVYIISGRHAGLTPECVFRCLSKNTASRSGVVFIPEKDDEVYLDWSYGPTPVITDHFVDVVNEETARGNKQKILPVESFGGADKFFKGLGRKPYRWGPADLMPGDKMIMGKLGNYLGILSGGLAVLRGGPLSQIILSKYRDYVKIISRNFELFTDFGIIRSRNIKGQTNFEILGNATGRKTNSIGETAWDYVFRLGGKNLLDLQLMRDKFQLSIDSDGHTTIKTAASFSVDMASAPEINITGNQTHNVDGSKEEFFTGDNQMVVRGTRTLKAGRLITSVSGADNKVVAGPVTKNYMRTFTETVRGTSATDLSTIGYHSKLAAGDYQITVGDPLDFGTPSVLLLAQLQTGSYGVKVFVGDIDFNIAIKGDIKGSTLLGNVDLSTAAGNVGMSTLLGNVSFSTQAGNIGLSTTLGNIEFLTTAGNATFGTLVGNVEIKATAGSIKLSAGTSSIELGPLGIKITNNGINMMDEIAETFTNLSTSVTPGFGGPLSSAPLFGTQLIKWKLFQGV